MHFHIISLFPESFSSYFSSSIMKKAQENGLFSLHFYDLYTYADTVGKRPDDAAYGMHGQVLRADILGSAIEDIFKKLGKKIPVIFLTPSGELLKQELVEKMYAEKNEDLLIICGHYEGIDERIVELYVDRKISIGEYVLSSGELAASVFIDALVRQIPAVLGNSLSLEEESFSKKLNRQKEYPVYTRPRIFKEKKVPDVLVSGNHKAIEDWKKNNLH